MTKKISKCEYSEKERTIFILITSIVIWIFFGALYYSFMNHIVLSGVELKEGVDILTNSIIFGGVLGFVFFIFNKWFGL